MLPFDVNSVGKKEGRKGEKKTEEMTEDGDETSAQVMRFRGVPWRSIVAYKRVCASFDTQKVFQLKNRKQEHQNCDNVNNSSC